MEPLRAPHRHRLIPVAAVATLATGYLTVRLLADPSLPAATATPLAVVITLGLLWAAAAMHRHQISIGIGPTLYLHGMDGTRAQMPLQPPTRLRLLGPAVPGQPPWQAVLTHPEHDDLRITPHMAALGPLLAVLSPYAHLAADDFTRSILADPGDIVPAVGVAPDAHPGENPAPRCPRPETPAA